jgi:hypothetical protein
MRILSAREAAIASQSVPESPAALKKLQQQPQKERLVARWLRDENNQLYCQWVKE